MHPHQLDRIVAAGVLLCVAGGVQAGNVLINEVHYNPPGDDDTVLLEFVELYNSNVTSVGIGLWELDFGPQPYVFPAGTMLEPGQYVVVADNAAALAGATGFATPFEWGGTNGLSASLDNGGEDIVLRDGPEGVSTVVDLVAYDDDPPWPAEPDGGGPSLELINPALDNNQPDSWLPSLAMNGTPGAVNSVFSANPVVAGTTPPPLTSVASLDEITVVFSEPVTGVTAADLEVAGSSATEVVPASGPADTYTFSGFAMPSPGSVGITLRPGTIAAGARPFEGYSWTVSVGLAIVFNEIHYHPPDPDGDAEFLELYNAGADTADMSGWSISDGLEFSFAPGTTLAPGEFLVLALDTSLLQSVTGYAGALQWSDGRLSNGGERLALADAVGNELDVVRFSDGGEWPAAADGDGPSLELINPLMPNDYGPAWAASSASYGTPGAINSAFNATPAPIIVHTRHEPVIPHALETVTVSAMVLDDDPNPVVTLYYRQDQDPTIAYDSVAMTDAGTNGDTVAGDDRYTAQVPGLADGERLDFTIRADDGTTVSAAPPGNETLAAGEFPAQTYLCKFSDAPLLVDFPQYHLITTQRTRNRQSIRNDVEYDATFVRCAADGSCEVFYNITERYRGATSMVLDPPSFRFSFPSDQPLESEMGFDITELNLMGQQPARQAIGYDMFAAMGLPAPRHQFIRLNTNPLVDGGTQDCLYINVERVDADFVESQGEQLAPRRFPDRCSASGDICESTFDCPMGESCLAGSGGNLYRGRDDADLRWEGFDPSAYLLDLFGNNGYQLITNEDNHDWTDLIDLCDALTCSAIDGGALCLEATYDGWYAQNIPLYVDADQWASWFAVHMALDNREGGIYRSTGDDYFLYFYPPSGRAVFMPWDMDAIIPGSQQTIWRTSVPSVRRFVRHNQFAGRFVKAICDLLDGELSQAAMDARIDALPDELFPTGASQGAGPQTKQGMKDWVTARQAFVRSEISTDLTLEGVPASPYIGTNAVVQLSGLLDQCGTQIVMVNGSVANSYSVYGATWSHDLTLVPGGNPIVVQCLDHLGQEIDRVEDYIDYQLPPSELRLTVPTRMVNDKTLTLTAELLDASGFIDWRGWNTVGTVSATRVSDGSAVPTSITVFETLADGAGGGTPPADSIRLYNGAGSVSITLDNGAAEPAGDILVTVDAAGLTASKTVEVLDVNSAGLFRSLSGTLTGDDLTWAPSDGVIHLTADVTVGPGSTLTILPGTLVMVDSGAAGSGTAVVVNGGSVRAEGTPDEPVFFFPTAGPAAMELPQANANNSASWRGLYHYGAAASTCMYTFVTGAGNGDVSIHPRSPILRLDGTSELYLDHCTLADCPGMGVSIVGGSSGRCQISRSLFSRLGIGGEFLGNDYTVDIADSWFTRIGRAPDANNVDGDVFHVDQPNNTIYLRRCVLTDCGDDLIDHSTGATPLIKDSILYDTRDTCVSLDGSTGATLSMLNCLVFQTPNGIQASGAVVRLLNSTVSAPVTGPSVDNTVFESIIWPNSYDSCAGDVRYSLLGTGGSLSCGTNNFTADPQWVNASASDYALLPWSPAIDAGSNGDAIGWSGFPMGGGALGLHAEAAGYCLSAGDTIELTLEVSALPVEISSVHALIRYDANRLLPAQVIPGDASGSPWDTALFDGPTPVDGDTLALHFTHEGGISADSVVARLGFQAVGDGPVFVELVPETVLTRGQFFDTRLIRFDSQDPPLIPAISSAYRSVVADTFDANADGVIDGDDYEKLGACLTGARSGLVEPDYPLGEPLQCSCFDVDNDGDIDLGDFADFQEAFGS